MFEFLETIDQEHPCFYARACTRCLECDQPISTIERRGEANFWFCARWCKEWVSVGLGTRNQVTRKIRWLERYEESLVQGTPLGFEVVEPEPAIYEVDRDSCGFCDDLDSTGEPISIITDSSPRPERWTYASLLAAMMQFRESDWFDTPTAKEIKVNGQPLTYHEIMEALSVLSRRS